MFSFFTINNRNAKKWHVVVVNLAVFIYLSSCATVKAEPCFIKSFSFPPGQVGFELTNSFFEVVDSSPEIMIDIVRPIHWGLVNFFELSVESVGEFFGGFIKYVSVSYLRGKAKPDRNENQSTTGTEQQEVRSGESSDLLISGILSWHQFVENP